MPLTGSNLPHSVVEEGIIHRVFPLTLHFRVFGSANVRKNELSLSGYETMIDMKDAITESSISGIVPNDTPLISEAFTERSIIAEHGMYILVKAKSGASSAGVGIRIPLPVARSRYICVKYH